MGKGREKKLKIKQQHYMAIIPNNAEGRMLIKASAVQFPATEKSIYIRE